MRLSHRWGIREPLMREVLLYGRQGKAVRGLSRDLGIDGMFISVPPATLLPGTRLGVAATCCAHDVTWMQRVSAFVARQNEQGAWLRFAVQDAHSIARFVALLRDNRSQLWIRQTPWLGYPVVR